MPAAETNNQVAARCVWTNDDGTMAAETARTRWPATVQNVVDDVEQSAQNANGGAKRDEFKRIADRIRAIKLEIEQNAKLQPLQPDGSADIDGFNKQLEGFGSCSWQAAPWLYSECYLYRRIQVLFASSTHWKGYDTFARSKKTAFHHSCAAVEELAKRYLDVINSNPADLDEFQQKLLFEEMTQIALWGNATDLSLLTKLSLKEIQGLQGAKAIAANSGNIVSNDMEQVWRLLGSGMPSQRIDIVLDNSGFELFTDLIYTSYLLQTGLARHVVLHAKEFPWFVSDVTPSDVEVVLSDLEDPSVFSGRPALDAVCKLLRNHFAAGEVSVQHHPFWTTGFSFHELPTAAPDLHADLRRSDLIIFKGDLNYRKLTIDGLWPHTTPFNQALGPIGNGSGLKILALRTNKADVCVGLPDEATVQKLNNEAPGLAWVRNGKYAVISFSDGL